MENNWFCNEQKIGPSIVVTLLLVGEASALANKFFYASQAKHDWINMWLYTWLNSYVYKSLNFEKKNAS